MMKFIIICSLFLLCLIGCCCSISDPLTEPLMTINDYFEMNDQSQYIILVLKNYGLANRFRSMADWYQIALLTNRKLLVAWVPSVECNITISELIESCPPGLSFLPEEIKSFEDVEALAFASKMSIYSYRNESLLFSQNQEFFVFNPRHKALNNDIQIILTSYDGVISMENIPCTYYLTKRSEFYQALRPVVDAGNTVQTVMDTYFKDYLPVAVHIRIHDEKYDWAVVPPLNGGTQAMKFGEGVTLDDFINAMKQIERKFEFPLLSKSLVRFFIASNDLAAKQEILKYFPTAISINSNTPDQGSRNHPEGVYLAFIEWLIISKAQLIIHTYGSSFAIESSQVNQRPLLGLKESYAIHYHNMYLPFCSHFLYAKAYSSSTETAEYTEGTTDNRKIKTVQIQLQYCDFLSNWGLDNVICLL